ncbi:MAG TPA: serine/threonine-protein kinase, partial [Polyangiaceae bacterium]|nr:serine/threonine-protein kinase [Polyangiaceae bacterium]
MPIQEGSYVTGSVRLVRLLGRGGMGSVWVAHHESLDAEVAVKFVAQELAERDPSLLERFRREAASSAKLKSPHAVKTFDHGVMKDGVPYIVMELLEGETLGARLAREGKLPPQQVAIVVTQVAHVLDEAHRLGVVHRDIKPDNIFLIAGGYELFVKVLDFGIAKQTTAAAATVTDTGAIVGTPQYMSPEQLLSTKSADYRADLWSLAVLAYHALTGQVPFRGETLPSLSIEICGGRFMPPSRLVQGLSQSFDDWFDRALDPEPARRFDSVLKMAELFGRVARGGELGNMDTVRTPPRISSSPLSARPTPVESVPGGTLASAAMDSEPPAATPPEVGVEEAAVDSGVRSSVPEG